MCSRLPPEHPVVLDTFSAWRRQDIKLQIDIGYIFICSYPLWYTDSGRVIDAHLYLANVKTEANNLFAKLTTIHFQAQPNALHIALLSYGHELV
ncbi:hypothetical protein SUGI_0063410 [Cryptomeria japonica]|nr:hypothetical protein SUGI_0063410 [Cryptomeria japonica]